MLNMFWAFTQKFALLKIAIHRKKPEGINSTQLLIVAKNHFVAILEVCNLYYMKLKYH